MTDCPLIHSEGCGWCGRPLTGRQKRWCSRACARAFTANHRWTQARAQARDAAAWYLCANAYFDEDEGQVNGFWDCLGFTQKPEVNHIKPIKGKHGTWGCHHHQNNLEVLCRPCHLRKTNEQRARGWE